MKKEFLRVGKKSIKRNEIKNWKLYHILKRFKFVTLV
jgi:hypothetical protein